MKIGKKSKQKNVKTSAHIYSEVTSDSKTDLGRFMANLDGFLARYVRNSPKGKKNSIPGNGEIGRFDLLGLKEKQVCHSCLQEEAFSGHE